MGEPEKINGTKTPSWMRFGEPGVDYPPYISKELLEAVMPKSLPKIKGLGMVMIFGTSGEDNNNTFEQLWDN